MSVFSYIRRIVFITKFYLEMGKKIYKSINFPTFAFRVQQNIFTTTKEKT